MLDLKYRMPDDDETGDPQDPPGEPDDPDKS